MYFSNEIFNITSLWRRFYVIEIYFTQEVICKELKIHKTKKAFSLKDCAIIRPFNLLFIFSFEKMGTVATLEKKRVEFNMNFFKVAT